MRQLLSTYPEQTVLQHAMYERLYEGPLDNGHGWTYEQKWTSQWALTGLRVQEGTRTN